MGGRDKGLLPFGDVFLVGHVIRAIVPQVGAAMISANRHREDYERFRSAGPGRSDRRLSGPLAGFLAGLQAMQTPYLLTLPCDGPVVIRISRNASQLAWMQRMRRYRRRMTVSGCSRSTLLRRCAAGTTSGRWTR